MVKPSHGGGEALRLAGECRKGRAGAGDGAVVCMSSRPAQTAQGFSVQPRRNPGFLSILSVLVFHPATTPPLFIFTAPSPAPPLMQIHSSTPPDRALLTSVLQLLQALSSSAAHTVPALTGGKGCGGRTTRPRCAAAPLHAWAGRGSDPAPCA
ncbi:PREDICTED: LOW QUALITY PROTEIN: putative uncharacterized protein RUSC1-AS1 [Myotis brandtii]|uniref:LOW QUALITY PROTEIN: putative uncharacterized protein RUSC1-AS1 n=1 Tax=Myotis brandtii TaxID=109478 RepID=UPI0007042BD0|nr:PREDICTED: LOW QUALITY PROTEIN: putative uncharacterized protein RUSC1-AS1 [Myotis brandtii]